MGIAEIEKYLKKQDGRLVSAREISVAVGTSVCSVSRSLRVIRKDDDFISMRVYGDKTNRYMYKYGVKE